MNFPRAQFRHSPLYPVRKLGAGSYMRSENMKKRNIKAVINVLPQVAETLAEIGYQAGTSGDNPPSKDRLDNQIQPLLDELAKSLLDEQAERIKANYADEYMTVEPSPSEERALLLRQAEISQENHTHEILRLQELNMANRAEIVRLREIIESMKASGSYQRKAVNVAILQFPLMAKAFSDLADAVESPEGKDIISNFARMADEAHDTIIEALNLNRVQH